MSDAPADEVRRMIDDYIDHGLTMDMGYMGEIRRLKFVDDVNDGGFPWVVEDSEGRRFEVEYEVHVTELTPEFLARREEEMRRLSDAIARSGVALPGRREQP